MRIHLLLVVLLAVLVAALAPAAAEDASAAARVRLETTKGAFVIELDAAGAPRSAANFLAYVQAGFYDGTVFHRVIPGFMVQGGGFTAELEQKATRASVANEAANGAKNVRGTVAMARTADPDSATSQFFVNLVDNEFLDRRSARPQEAGYTVFGRVVEGMKVVDAIAAVETGTVRARPLGAAREVPFQDVPLEPVVILKAVVVGEPAQSKSDDSAS